jgi:CheY-like chemotaxis protein
MTGGGELNGNARWRVMNSPIVLCIDDRPQLLNLRKTALESQGYCVKTASSGYSALQMLHEMSADVVLLEFKMEGLDPEAIACHIKTQFPTIPIVLLSAFSEMPERILWLVDEYVLKSEIAELPRIIEQVTHRDNQDERCTRQSAVAA